MSEQQAPKKRVTRKAFLPIMGLTLAVLLVVVSYALAPLALEGLGEINAEWGNKVRVNENPNGEFVDEFVYLMTFVLWFVLMGLAMVVVSAAVGKDPETASLQYMGAPPANKKAVAKQLKRDLRDAKRRARRQKREKK
jgi:hypothetical protein